MDNLFYTTEIDENRACLTDEEFRHAITVLRNKPGDALQFTDGKGHIFQGRLTDVGRREAWMEIESSEKRERQSFALHLAVAPTKSFDRMAWCIEKLTEVGITQFTPLICARSERQKWKPERAEKVAISAMKQSQRAFLPQCTPAVSFNDFVTNLGTGSERYLAVQSPESIVAIGHYPVGRDVIILIGPEGDFTEEEIRFATDNGFAHLSLGNHRLRTETAAVFAAVTIHTLNQK